MNLKKIGKLLCNLRKSKGMTQKQVADKLGVLPKTVSKWETGHGFPEPSLISGLSEILGVSLSSVGPGASDTITFCPLIPSDGISAMAKIRIPMPPIQ